MSSSVHTRLQRRFRRGPTGGTEPEATRGLSRLRGYSMGAPGATRLPRFIQVSSMRYIVRTSSAWNWTDRGLVRSVPGAIDSMSPSALVVSSASRVNGPSGFQTCARSACLTDSATRRLVASCTVFGDFERPERDANAVLVEKALTHGSAAVAWLQHSSSPLTNSSGTP